MHITASVFINDDEYGLHQDYEKWLEELAPHAPTSQCRPKGRLHNRTGQARGKVCLRQAPVLDAGTGCRRAPEAAWAARLWLR